MGDEPRPYYLKVVNDGTDEDIQEFIKRHANAIMTIAEKKAI